MKLHRLGSLLALASACVQIAGIERAQEIAAAAQGCTSAADCDDRESCTLDGCDAGACTHTPLPDGPLPKQQQTAGDCRTLRCDAGKSTVAADDSDVPDDNKPCTKDACSGGKPSHTPVPKDVACKEGSGIRCDGNGACVECTGDSHCVKPNTCGATKPNQCGCSPKLCANEGVTCGVLASDGCGKVLDCNDMKQNGGETDVDCGGPPSTCNVRCQPGKKCQKTTDCASRMCNTMTMLCS